MAAGTLRVRPPSPSLSGATEHFSQLRRITNHVYSLDTRSETYLNIALADDRNSSYT